MTELIRETSEVKTPQKTAISFEMIISISEQQQQHEDRPDENMISINVMLIL